MAEARQKWRMLIGLTLMLSMGIAIVWMMAILEPLWPRAGKTVSNCWWYAMVKFWKEGGAVVLHQSSYTTIQHFAWTDDFETFLAFDPPSKRRRFLPPPFFNGAITTTRLVDVLARMAPKAA